MCVNLFSNFLYVDHPAVVLTPETTTIVKPAIQGDIDSILEIPVTSKENGVFKPIKCTLSQEELSDPTKISRIVRTACQHIFDADWWKGLEASKSTNPNCPYCKNKVNQYTIFTAIDSVENFKTEALKKVSQGVLLILEEDYTQSKEPRLVLMSDLGIKLMLDGNDEFEVYQEINFPETIIKEDGVTYRRFVSVKKFVPAVTKTTPAVIQPATRELKPLGRLIQCKVFRLIALPFNLLHWITHIAITILSVLAAFFLDVLLRPIICCCIPDFTMLSYATSLIGLIKPIHTPRSILNVGFIAPNPA